jgi:antitoxin FitA
MGSNNTPILRQIIRVQAAEAASDRRGTAAPRFDMSDTCSYASNRSRMIQIRNVPVELRRRLKARAAVEGKSLSDYLLSEIREAAKRPTLDELRARLARRVPVTPSMEPALAG